MDEKIFTKKFVWNGKNGAGSIFAGESDTERGCIEDATQQGSSTCYASANPNYQLPAEDHISTKVPPVDEIATAYVAQVREEATAAISAANADAEAWKEKAEALAAEIAQVREEAQQAANISTIENSAWQEKAKGLADLLIAGWNGLLVAGMQLPENTPEPDFIRLARALVSPTDQAALDTAKKTEADQALK